MLNQTPVQQIDLHNVAEDQRTPLLLIGGFILALVWTYWEQMMLTSTFWDRPLYSHGYIIPFFSLGLLWMEYKPFKNIANLERWVGVGIIACALGLRVIADYYDMQPLDRITFVISLFGIFTMVGGWHTIKWSTPGLFFILFMFPLPSLLEQKVLLNLQTLASYTSTAVLQTAGVAVIREGNVLNINAQQLEVADACSGLRMLTIFVAMAVALVFLLKERPWWDRLAILISSIPIALFVNIVRIVITCFLYMKLGRDNETVKWIVHDGAGLLMMPMAFGCLLFELWLLGKITTPIESSYQAGPGRGGMMPTS